MPGWSLNITTRGNFRNCEIISSLVCVRMVDGNDFSGVGDPSRHTVNNVWRQLSHLCFQENRTGKQISHILRYQHGGCLHGIDGGHEFGSDIKMLQNLIRNATDVINCGRQNRAADPVTAWDRFRKDSHRNFLCRPRKE